MKKISVIMGLYNCADTLEAAVGSIDGQTYPNWELILCEDGSSDQTWALAQKIRDEHPDRVILLRNEQNLGLNRTLNRCLSAATGEYIARMDADDLCSPDRFEVEAEFLDTHPEYAFVSVGMEHFDEQGTWGRQQHRSEPCAIDFVRGTPFNHAAAMVRREAYASVGGYCEEDRYLRVEDYNLWIRLYAKGFRGKNLQQFLYQMRDDRNAYRRRKFSYRVNEARVIALAVRELKLPAWRYIHTLRPILVGLLPAKIYDRFHKNKLNRQKS